MVELTNLYWNILKVMILIIIFILAYSLLQFVLSIHPPRYYSSNTPRDFKLDYENVSLTTADNIKLKAWLIPSEKAKSTVIIGHGYPFDKGNILPVARFLHPDYNLLFYDHRYFGESQGRITTVGLREVEDVKVMIDFVKKRFPQQPIALYGFSLSASAMLMSNPDPQKVKAIIADSPYANLELMVKRIYSLFGPLKWPFVQVTSILTRIFFQTSPSLVSPQLAVENKTIPILLIHGEDDSQIAVENSRLIYQSNPQVMDLWLVKGADHGQSYALKKNEYEQRVKEFLKKNMK